MHRLSESWQGIHPKVNFLTGSSSETYIKKYECTKIKMCKNFPFKSTNFDIKRVLQYLDHIVGIHIQQQLARLIFTTLQFGQALMEMDILSGEVFFKFIFLPSQRDLLKNERVCSHLEQILSF